MKFYINDTQYAFELATANGSPVLAATYEQRGESHTIWTPDVDRLPADEAEATEWMDALDWAVEAESYLDYNKEKYDN